MRIGILQCDHVRDIFREQGFDSYPDMFMDCFNRAAPNLEFASYDCVSGEFPENPRECDAFITTGSRHSVLDDFGWIDTLEDFVLDTLDAGTRYVGICFGHQLLAPALGGRVVQADVGWGVGVSSNTIATPQWWMGDERKNHINLIVSHQDQVVELPSDVAVLGGSEFCPIYFCQLGDNAFTVQGHPEFSRGYSRALMEFRRDIIPAPVVETGLASLEKSIDDDLFFRWIVKFMSGQSVALDEVDSSDP